MPPQLTLPFRSRLTADGQKVYESWPISNLFDDPRTRGLYTKFGLAGHEGIDWACYSGTPIHAMAAGTVIEVGNDAASAYGNYIKIKSGGAYELTYAHLAVTLVDTGDTVAQGDLIGVSGTTGNSSRSHLHVRYRPLPLKDTNGFQGAEDFKDYLIAHPYEWVTLQSVPPDATEAEEKKIAEANQVMANKMNASVKKGHYAVLETSQAAVSVYDAPTAAANKIAALSLDTPYAIVGKDNAEWDFTAINADPPWISIPTPCWWQIEVTGNMMGWILRKDVTYIGDAKTLHHVSLTYREPRVRVKPGMVVPVQSGPGTEHPKQTELEGGYCTWYAVIEEHTVNPTWYHIQYSAHVAGWVPAAYVQVAGDMTVVPAVYVPAPTDPPPVVEPTPPPATEAPAASEGPYLNLAENHDGRWTVSKAGTTVTATFRTTRSPVQYYAVQGPEDLMVLPDGFRPTTAQQWTVTGAQEVLTDGTDKPDGLPSVSFQVRVGTDGALRYVDDGTLGDIGYLKYETTRSWTAAGEAVNPPAAPPDPPDAEATGTSTNQAENHNGRYALTRTGTTVTGTFGTDRSPVQYFAVQQPEVIFWLPDGFRPTMAQQWTVTEAKEVLTDGTDKPDGLPSVSFQVRVGTDGALRYVDDGTLGDIGYLKYETTHSWPVARPVTAPGAPAQLQVDVRSHTQVRLDWMAPSADGGAAITGYRIERWRNGAWRTVVADTGSGQTQHTLADLAAHTVYTWRVRALNQVGPGPASAAVSVQTPAAPLAKPGTPTDLTATATHATVTVRWTAPSSGGPIHGYRLQRRLGSNGSWTTLVTDTGATLTYWTDDTVATATAYGYRVRAQNDDGPGSWSGTVSVTTATAPPELSLKTDAPTDLVLHAGPGATYEVVATLPAETTAHYCIVGRDAATPAWWQVQLGSILTAWAPVAAVQTYGDLSSVPVVTLASPSDVTATLASGAVTLAWTAPASGTAVTGYRLWRQTDDGAFVPLEMDRDATVLTHTDTTVANNHIYRYWLQALSAMGPGLPSATVAVAVMATPVVPAPVTDVQVTATPTTLQLRWQRAATGGLPTAYRVQWRVQDTTADFPAVAVRTTAHVLTDLVPATSYAVQITAFNQVGDAAATAHTARTLAVPPGTSESLAVTVAGQDATATWQAPATGGQPDAYHLQAKLQATPDWPAAVTTVTGLTHTLTGLGYGVTYDLRLRAANTAGHSPWVQTPFTTALAAPDTPTGLKTKLRPYSVRLSWTAPTTVESVVGYEVQRRRASETTWTTVAANTGDTQTTWEDTTVAPTTVYAWRVRARFAAGPGPWAAAAAATTARAWPQASVHPDVTPDVVVRTGPGTHHAPLTTLAAGNPTRYLINARDADPAAWWELWVGTVTGFVLANGSVGWVLRQGMHGWVAAAQVQTHGDVDSVRVAAPELPDIPTDLTATLATNAVSLSWQAPNTGTAVTGYRLWRQTDAGEFASLGTDLQASTILTHTDTTVATGHVYRYRVQALAAGGGGALSAPVAVAVMATPVVPAAVTHLTVAATPTTLQLTWQRAATGGLPTAYRVQWRVQDTSDAYQQVTVTGLPHTLTDLAPGTAYALQVVAFNQVGDAPATSGTGTTAPAPGS